MRRYLLAVALSALAPAASAQDWYVFKSDRFGFEMLVAPGTRWEARDFGNGWGGLRARKGVLEFLGIVALDRNATAAEIERSAVELTKVPAAAWKMTDEGRNQNGWKWWRTYQARLDETSRILFAVLGTGPRGSYLLLLETSQVDFAANKSLYEQWYRSLKLY